MFEVAAGILIAAGAVAVISFGMTIALDKDNQAL